MKRPRMAFVMTASLLGLAACEKTPKGGGGECKPPDCHINPPPPPQPTERSTTSRGRERRMTFWRKQLTAE